MSELKKCPFCGSEAKDVSVRKDNSAVQCSNRNKCRSAHDVYTFDEWQNRPIEDTKDKESEETMEIRLPPKQCSKCGSTNSETFQRIGSRGIRCLDCGHEVTEKDIQDVGCGDTYTWTSDTTTLPSF